MDNNNSRSIVNFSSRCIFAFLACINFVIVVKLFQMTEPQMLERFPSDNPYLDIFGYIFLFLFLTFIAYMCTKTIRLFWEKIERIELLCEESD